MASLPPAARPKSGAIWAMKFNKDGRYLAAGGQDQVVRVWQVIGTENERCEHEKEEDAAGTEGTEGTDYVEGGGRRLNAPVFKSEPIQEYYGHTADILDLSWSKVCESSVMSLCVICTYNILSESIPPIILHG